MSNIKREIQLVLHLIEKLDPNHTMGYEKENVSMTVEDGCKAACLLSTVLESVESIYCTPAPKVEDDDKQDPEQPFPVPPITPTPPFHPKSLDELESYEADKDTFLQHIYGVLTSGEDACTALSIAIGILKATESKVCANHD